MNIGDYVYVYLFDLESSIANMSKLRDDRFGRIVSKSILSNNSSNDIISYDIELLHNKKIIQYRTDNLSTNIMSIDNLKNTIDNMDMSLEKKFLLTEQIKRAVKA